DGFRFDLSPVLARELFEVNRLSAVFDIIHQDPVLSRVKLIAEPWDVGPGGYQVGNFPVGWAEWNGKYRDAVRRFWRGDAGVVPELASRLSGSADIYARTDRSQYASVNFITAHDGFTLNDLVSYEQKHNESNGEKNRDGHDDNICYNWGVEGATDDERIVELRARARRNFLSTLILSQGVTMLSHGDEMGRSQQGNNNAYAQDNETSWVDWNLDAEQKKLLAFTRKLVSISKANPVLRRRHFFTGKAIGLGQKDLTWLRPDGQEMGQSDWDDHSSRVLGMLIDGEATDETDWRGRPVKGDTLLLIVNAGTTEVEFCVPPLEHRAGLWSELLDTAHRDLFVVRAGAVRLAPHSLVLLRHGTDRRMTTDIRPTTIPAPTQSPPVGGPAR
ncbi:MAG: glycogen debranching protein GlgX, partial [Gemmatimonadaceae bacterium]